MKFGDIYYADLSPVIGSEQGGIRPVLILQDTDNKINQNITCAPVSTAPVAESEIHISLSMCTGGLEKSYILMEQIRNIDKNRLKNKLDSVPEIYHTELKNKMGNVLSIR